MMVAVLSVPILSGDPSKNNSNINSNNNSSVPNSLSPSRVPSPPPGPSNICSVLDAGSDSNTNTPVSSSVPVFYSEETSAFVTEVEEKLSEYQRPENIRRSMSIGSFASILECNGSDESSDSSWDKMAIPTVAAATTTTTTATRASVYVDDANERHTPPTNGISKPVLQLQDTTFPEPSPSPSKQNYLAPLSLSGSSTPIRKIRLHSESSEIGLLKNRTLGKFLGRKKKTISVHSSEVSKIKIKIELY